MITRAFKRASVKEHMGKRHLALAAKCCASVNCHSGATAASAPNVRISGEPMRAFHHGRSIVAFLFAVLATPGSALAQNVYSPPELKMIDRNSVRMPSGEVSVTIPQLSIGGAHPLVQEFSNWSPYDSHPSETSKTGGFYPGYPFRSSLEGGWSQANVGGGYSTVTFSFGNASESFVDNYGTPGPSLSHSGGIMVQNADGVTWTYTDKAGTQYLIDTRLLSARTAVPWPVTRVTKPDGEIITIAYKMPSANSQNGRRMQGVSSNFGYFIKYEYSQNIDPLTASAAWSWPATIKAGNLAVDYCDVSADSCSVSQGKTATVSWGANHDTLNFRNAAGQTMRLTQNGYYEIIAIKPFDSSVDTITYEMCGRSGGNCTRTMAEGDGFFYWLFVNGGQYHYFGKVYRSTSDGELTTYTPSQSCNCQEAIVSTTFYPAYRPVWDVTSWVPGGLANGSLIRARAQDGKIFNYSKSNENRVTSVADTIGRTLSYTYDGRANITQVTDTPAGNGTALVQTAVFPASCTNPVTCNKPTSVTDARGNTTNYSYDPVHGGLLTETLPAGSNGVRPQKRYEYAQRYPWYKNASGSVVQAPSPIWLLVRERFCRTTAASGLSCAGGAADEVVTAYDYGPAAGSNNLNLRGIAVTADGATRRTCFSYNQFGDRVSETTPSANLTSCP